MLVLDSSAAIAIAMDKPEGRKLQKLMREGEKIVAPELFYAEVVHALCKYVRGNHIDKCEALDLLQDAVALVSEFVPMEDSYVEALSESLGLSHSSYDLFYLILARRTGATLFTLDKSLAKLAQRCYVGTTVELEVDGEPWSVRSSIHQMSDHMLI